MPSPQCPSLDRWQQHLLGDVPDAEQADLVAHLGDCATCQQTLQTLAGGESLLDVAREVGQEPAAEPVPARMIAGLKGQSPSGETQAEAVAADDEPLDFLQPSDQPGSLGRLGHYEILAVVGRGGMGVVLRARDTLLQRVVAVKVLAPQLAVSGVARQRFLREGQAAAAVCHEHVVTIHGVEPNNRVPYLVMQYVAGVSLQERLRQNGALAVREVLRIGLQAAQGLGAAHAQGLVHRDVKPANILLENGVERVKITDFGLARAAEDVHLTQTGCLAGTPMYMSPEQADGQGADARSDLFSLGSVLYEMCTGYPPFGGKTRIAVLRAVAEASPRPVRQLNPEVPEGLAEVIAKLMARTPRERYQTADEVAGVLGQRLAELQRMTPAPSGRRRVPRRLLMLGGGVAAGLAAALLLVLFLLKSPVRTGVTEKAPKVALNLPDDLARLKPVVDKAWNTPDLSADAPHETAPGDQYKMDDYPSREESIVVQFRPLANHSGWRGSGLEGNLSGVYLKNFACRLTGRMSSKEHTALSVMLHAPQDRGRLVIHLQSKGSLVVEKFQNAAFNFHALNLDCKRVMRGDDRAQELLLIVQERRMRVFVNDQEIADKPIELPEEVLPAELGRSAFSWGPDKGRVEYKRWTVWDLDHPVMESEKPATVTLNLPADLARLTPGVDKNWNKIVPPADVEHDVNPKWKIDLFLSTGAFVIEFGALPGHVGFRQNLEDPEGFHHSYACRLAGRIKRKDRTSLSISLMGRGGQRFLVHLMSYGSLQLDQKLRSDKLDMLNLIRCQGEMLGEDESQELLVIVQERQLRVFVNGHEVLAKAVELLEEFVPAGCEKGAFIWGPDKGRIEWTRWTVWDLDNPNWEGGKPAANEKKSAE